jgi:GNAT superfamily N-acetyltransferase
MEIRPYSTKDLQEIYEIALATGFAGEDASSYLKDANLIGHIYAAPYATLKPELTWVAVDEHGVCGYVVGVEDTEAWESQLEEQWWPSLRSTYVQPEHGEWDSWTHDESHIEKIFHPQRTPTPVIKHYPAHVHLNLLPRAQKKGVGALLFRRWVAVAVRKGITAMHIGANRNNAGGLMFWHKQGFVEIDTFMPQDATVWLGLLIA